MKKTKKQIAAEQAAEAEAVKAAWSDEARAAAAESRRRNGATAGDKSRSAMDASAAAHDAEGHKFAGEMHREAEKYNGELADEKEREGNDANDAGKKAIASYYRKISEAHGKAAAKHEGVKAVDDEALDVIWAAWCEHGDEAVRAAWSDAAREAAAEARRRKAGTREPQPDEEQEHTPGFGEDPEAHRQMKMKAMRQAGWTEHPTEKDTLVHPQGGRKMTFSVDKDKGRVKTVTSDDRDYSEHAPGMKPESVKYHADAARAEAREMVHEDPDEARLARDSWAVHLKTMKPGGDKVRIAAGQDEFARHKAVLDRPHMDKKEAEDVAGRPAGAAKDSAHHDAHRAIREDFFKQSQDDFDKEKRGTNKQARLGESGRAHEASRKAFLKGDAESHDAAAHAHGFAEKWGVQEHKERHAQLKQMHSRFGTPAKAAEPDPAAGQVVRCQGSTATIAMSGELPTSDFQWMPGGKTNITATYGGKPITLCVECDEDTAGIIQKSFEAAVKASPRRPPYGCVEHREEEAAFHPVAFKWSDDPEPGIMCTAEWTPLGTRNVRGKIHTSFSPSFTTDAEYSKATCGGCDKLAARCKCPDGTVQFPEGVRGSESNPARVTGVSPRSVGSLTNWPAFKNILPVRAKQAPQPGETNAGNEQRNKRNKVKMKFIQARGEHAVGAVVDLEADHEYVLDGSALPVKAADRVLASEQARIDHEKRVAEEGEAKIVAACERAVARRALLPKGEKANSRDVVQAKHVDRFKKGQASADIIVELIDAMRGEEDEALEEQARLGARLTSGSPDTPVRAYRGEISLKEACTAYIKARLPFKQLFKNGKVQDAELVGKQSGVIMATEIMSKMRNGDDFALPNEADLVRAAGLDVSDPDSLVGTLATGMVIMRNLGFLKSKLGWMNYISTDLRNEPVQFGQTVRTRYIVPPALLTYIPGVGYTRDTTTISNASATSAQDGVAIQTSGTRTSSMGAATTKGDTAATANAVDVDVKLDQHKGVEVEFSTNKLGSTARNLFAEQQGAQFYSLAEAINIFFLQKLAAATWTGPVTSFSLGNFALPGMVKLKNRMTLNRMPDLGRFALLYSEKYDGLLVDSNLLTSKAIMALINKDASAFEQSDLPPLFGIKPIETQLSTFASGTWTSPTIDPDGNNAVTYNTINFLGLAGNSASALFVARLPQDYTKALPDIPATAAVETITEPDSGLSVLFVKHINHTLAQVAARAALMYGAAQGDPRQGIPLKP